MMGEVYGTTNALESCWKMLRRNGNLKMDEGNNGNSTAKKNNMLKILTYKTSKFKNERSFCDDTS